MRTHSRASYAAIMGIAFVAGCSRASVEKPAGATSGTEPSAVHADEPPRVPLAPQDGPAGRPDAVVDLASEQGVRLVKGQWRYSDVKIMSVQAKAPGPDLKPSGKPISTYDYAPKAGAADFDDSGWEAI